MLPSPAASADARKILLGAALPITNCVLIMMLLLSGGYAFPTRDLASLGVCFSMMILWTPFRWSHATTTSGRLACWGLSLLSGLFLALLLMIGLDASAA